MDSRDAHWEEIYRHSKMDKHVIVMKRFVAYLKKRLDAFRKEEQEYFATLKCTFCGELDSVCGGDHSEEMYWLSQPRY